MGKQQDEFDAFRSRLNERILSEDHAAIKRFLGVDTLTYKDGALPARTKEMLGLCASLALRCDDCVRYHILECRKAGVSRPEFFDIFSVALTVGGSIVIPHLRRAVDFLDELESTNRDRMV
jgi:AhpD family alkylhydroperoxidase